MDSVVGALKGLASSKQVGKVVVNSTVQSLSASQKSMVFFGGLGSLGMFISSCMQSDRFQPIVLTGRSGHVSGTDPMIGKLCNGANTHIFSKVDVTSTDDMSSFSAMLFDTPSLAIIHASGILIDSSILKTDMDRMRKVFSPKILGIQKMQASHGGYALEAEISFSSFSAVLGSPGQCSYTCANAYMDAYISGMSSRGLQASSIQWGAWAEVGMAARNVDNLRRLEKLGLSGLDPLKGVLLNSYIMNAQGQIGRRPSTVAAADVDWYTFLDLSLIHI